MVTYGYLLVMAGRDYISRFKPVKKKGGGAGRVSLASLEPDLYLELEPTETDVRG